MHEGGPHIPVLISAILSQCAPIRGTWIDGTFGAGGYTRALLDAGASHVIAIDRDPLAFDLAAPWLAAYEGRITLVQNVFSKLDQAAGASLANGLADGVVLDLGVSSMQLDLAERGFSFLRDGPLDMRMSQSGPSAADLVNEQDESVLADILFQFGEERASRRIARAIVKSRADAPITTTLALAQIIEGCLPRARPGQSHPATRSFQALRIAVNDEYGELWRGLMAAERALAPNGHLAVVTFHSVEDRMVKRFLTARTGGGGRANRYAPEAPEALAQFRQDRRKATAPDGDEIAANPRARSAKLRVAQRTEVPAEVIAAKALSMPVVSGLSS